MEKYLQVEWGPNMVFRDSLQFLSALMEQLAASLTKVGRENFKNFHDVVTDVYPETDVELLERKGVFFYNSLDSFARLDEPSLPSREDFFNKLGGVECLPANYAHAQHVWENFHCSSLKEYMALYILSDICMLADVFQSYRNNLYMSTSSTRTICKRAATRVERVPKAHRHADPADHRPGNVSDDPVKHPLRYLPRKRPLRPF